MCDDYSFACNERNPLLTTTLSAPDRRLGSIQFGGLMSDSISVNPDFADANQVLAQYCSSDFWSGATTQRRPSTGDPSRGWYFSGHANVDAMIQILAERYGLDDSRNGLRVMFGGSSAGAFGAHFNAARVANELPSAAASGRLLLLVDAGWMTAWDDPDSRLGNATTSDRDVWSRARDFWAATFDPNCEAREADKVNCFFGPGWYPHVSTEIPTFVQQSSTDFSFMEVHGITTTDSATVAAWRAQVSESLVPVTWLFSGDRFYHTLGLQDAGMTFGPAGSTFGETVGRFWAGEPRERVVF